VLTLLAGLPLIGRAALATPAPTSTIAEAMVLIAGPDGGLLDRWSRVVQPALAQALPPETLLTRNAVGGPDGVTGANQFATRGDPDGRTLLLAPGDAAIAWLVGDPRAKYDLGRWTSVMACLTPGVLVVRPGALRARKSVRIAMPGLASTGLAGLLALEILGVTAEPVLSVPTEGVAEGVAAAFARGTIDAAFARGHKVDRQVAELVAAGGQPLLALGGRDEAGRPVRDEAFPTLPVLTELTQSNGPLLDAFLSASTAARLECTLVLPQLTPAARVALWRQAATEATAALDVQALALAVGARVVSGAEASAAAPLTSPQAMQALRQWLVARHKWRPA
jgi:hypothetical protein